MLPNAYSILDVIECADDSSEIMERVQIACLKRFSDLFVSGLAHAEEQGIGVAHILDIYNSLDETWRARLLFSAEFTSTLAEMQHVNGEKLIEKIDESYEIASREHFIYNLVSSPIYTNLFSENLSEIWSPMGDLRAVKGENGWRLHRSTTIGGSISLDFDSPISLAHEIRSGVLSQPCLEVSDDERIAIAHKLQEALNSIEEVEPIYASLIKNFTRRIIVRKSIDDSTDRSTVQRLMSSEHVSRQPGCIRFLNPHIKEKTMEACMESLLHESIHVFITSLENANGVFHSPNKQTRPVSPWSGNLIPNSAYSHAIFIYYACHSLFIKILDCWATLPNINISRIIEKLQHFAAGFMVNRTLCDQYTEDWDIDRDLIAAINIMQERMKEKYIKA